MNEILKIDGFDDAIIGTCAVTDRIVYSIDKMVDIYCETLHFDDDENPQEIAIEYIMYNIVGAYMGEGTPIYMFDKILDI